MISNLSKLACFRKPLIKFILVKTSMSLSAFDVLKLVTLFENFNTACASGSLYICYIQVRVIGSFGDISYFFAISNR